MADLQQQIQDVVDELIGTGAERGLQVAVYRHGEPVVAVAAGQDAAGRPVAAGTPPGSGIVPMCSVPTSPLVE